MTMEMPINSQMPTESEHKVVGLPPEENTRFWNAEDKFNSRYIRAMDAYIILAWFIFDLQLFVIKFPEVDLWLYVLVQAFHIANGHFFMYTYFHSMYTGTNDSLKICA